MTPTATPDLSEFERLTALSPPKRTECPIGRALTALSRDERAQLEAALAQPNSVITAKAVCLWLEKRGVDVKYGRIKAHRKGECSCAQD